MCLSALNSQTPEVCLFGKGRAMLFCEEIPIRVLMSQDENLIPNGSCRYGDMGTSQESQK